MKSFNWLDGQIPQYQTNVAEITPFPTGKFIGKKQIMGILFDKEFTFGSDGIANILHNKGVEMITSACVFEGGTEDNGRYWNMVPWTSDTNATHQTRLVFITSGIYLRRRNYTGTKRFRGYIEYIPA